MKNNWISLPKLGVYFFVIIFLQNCSNAFQYKSSGSSAEISQGTGQGPGLVSGSKASAPKILKIPGGQTIDTNICSSNLQTQQLAVAEVMLVPRYSEVQAHFEKIKAKPELQSLNSAEVNSLIYYSLDGYQPISLALQGNPKSLKENRHILTCALSGLKKLPLKVGTFFHGEFTLATEWKTKFRKKSVYSTQKFLSTTEKLSLALDFATVPAGETYRLATLFVIQTKSGRTLEAVSMFSGEGEILLAPQTRFEIEDARLLKTGEEGVSMDVLRVKMKEL